MANLTSTSEQPSSSSTSSQPDLSSSFRSVPSTVTVPPPVNFKRSNSSKMDYLYELSYIPDERKIQETSLRFLNPYDAFSKHKSSLTRTIRSLIKPSIKSVKEYVQASSFDQCPIQASGLEQFINLEIPPEFVQQWITQGYTHMHFGAIRLVVSYHGRKGLPVFARISLLDRRYLQYQHVVIGTVETSLNAGTIMFTFYPNYNMALKDPNLLKSLQVQIQIVGAPQVSSSIPFWVYL